MEKEQYEINIFNDFEDEDDVGKKVQHGSMLIIEEEKKEDFDEEFDQRLIVLKLLRKKMELEQADAALKTEERERLSRVYQPNAPG